MNEQIFLNELGIKELLIFLEPKINKELHQTNYVDREDLKQEIKLKIIEIEHKIKEIDAPGFWEFFNQKVKNSS